jgi:hypothetical protein
MKIRVQQTRNLLLFNEAPRKKSIFFKLPAGKKWLLKVYKKENEPEKVKYGNIFVKIKMTRQFNRPLRLYNGYRPIFLPYFFSFLAAPMYAVAW